jgi:hypothetical protein
LCRTRPRLPEAGVAQDALSDPVKRTSHRCAAEAAAAAVQHLPVPGTGTDHEETLTNFACALARVQKCRHSSAFGFSIMKRSFSAV